MGHSRFILFPSSQHRLAIDVLKMVRPAGQDRKAAYDRDYEALVGLRELSKELGIAIIVAHHTRKAAADDLIDMAALVQTARWKRGIICPLHE